MSKLNLEKYTTIILGLLFFFLPLWRWIENILLVLLFLIFILKYREKFNIKLLKTSLIGFVLYTIIRTIVAQEIQNDTSSITSLLPLIIVPIFCIPFSKKDINTGLTFLSVGIILMQLIALFKIGDYYFFTEGTKIRLANHSKVNTVIGFERPYIGFFSALNVIISYHLFKLNKKWMYLIPILLAVAVIILISARLGFIIITLSGILIILTELKNNKKIILGISIVVICLFIGLLTQKNLLAYRFKKIQQDARTIIWKGAIKQITDTENYIFGNGGQKKIRAKLLDYYKNDAEITYLPKKQRFIKKNYNTHNQFLNEFIKGGFFAIVLFLIPFLILLYKNIVNYNIVGILFLISILAFCMVENLLERQKGIYLIALVLASTKKINETA